MFYSLHELCEHEEEALPLMTARIAYAMLQRCKQTGQLPSRPLRCQMEPLVTAAQCRSAAGGGICASG